MSKEIKKYGYRYFTPEEIEIVSKILHVPKERYIRIGPKGYTINKNFLKYMDDIINLELRPDDVYVVTYQRSGTTLTQELVWMIGNDFNYEKAMEIPLTRRFPFVEYPAYFDDVVINKVYELAGRSEKTDKFVEEMITPATSYIATDPSPRFIKTHLPMSLINPNVLDTAKVVYVARDPRDIVVSYYHQSRLFKMLDYRGTFKEFWNTFVNDLNLNSPYFEHVKEAWALRNHPNMLFLFYEDITKKLPETIKVVAKFLGKEITQEQIDRLCDHLSVENFKNNPSVNFEDIREYGLLNDEEKFIRKGKTGGWRDYFDEEMLTKTNQWIAKNLKDTDLRFPTIQEIPNV